MHENLKMIFNFVANRPDILSGEKIENIQKEQIFM